MPAKETSEKSVKKSSAIQEYFYGTGRRKTSVARVRLYKNGNGEVTVNEKEAKKYFPLKKLLATIEAPLKLTATNKKFDISVKVSGGGVVAQAEAIRHGVSRALLNYDEALRITLKKAGYLTRDSRVKERMKPGLKKARRAPQFSKR